MTYSVVQKSRNIAIIRINHSDNFEQEFLLTADRHWDNPYSDHDMQLRHLAQARKKKAGVIDIGDFFCAMQGKFDKRANKSAVRSEHQVDDYLDALVNTASKFFAKYAKDFIMIGMGNHETSIVKRCETNLTNNLIEKLNRNGGNIYNGGYSGWILFEFLNTKTKEITQKKLWYIHGYGGGGPVTRGVIQSNRRAVYLPDADIVLSGHTHDEWIVPISRTRLDSNGVQSLDEQIHVQIPSYKDEYSDGFGGWHIERGGPPKPNGAIWLRFSKESDGPLAFDFLSAR